MSLSEDLEKYEKLMERLVGAYKARMTKICKGEDLTPPQFFALHSIGDVERIKMSPLADALGLSMGAASTLIDRLVSRDLVERKADPDDRRAVYVSLTAKGRRVLDDAIGARRQMSRQIFERVAPEARSQFVTGLEALVAAWESLPACDTAD